MQYDKIPISIKRKCCEMKLQGFTSRQIYDTYFTLQIKNPIPYPSFKVTLVRWSKKPLPDETTLAQGTYSGFIAHDATVQVSKDGTITQAWIKQKACDIDPEEFIEAIRDTVEPYYPTITCNSSDSKNMLEIPLFDMHWGISFMDYYEPVLVEILELISKHRWNQIVIPFGQDFFHNDSIANGQTTKGTNIEKVDTIRAVKEAKKFVYSLIDNAIANADSVKVIYSAGNHDRSISWMFTQVLLERYGKEIVDDSMTFRKVVTYGQNAIMVTHGDSKRATPKNLAPIFSVSFPEEFSKADIREIHAGHLHTEYDTDVFGVMVRRLSSGNKTDEWSDKEDFIGSHKRFMVFEWTPTKLKSIHYI